MSDNSFIRILIVEDNDVSRDMMAALIRTQGFDVIGAIDGETAITVIEEKPVDLILLDLNMAPMGGFEFVRYLVSKGIKIPTVIITSDESGDILVKANDLGVQQVLQKPVKPDRLHQTVHRILKGQGIKTKAIAVEAHTLSHSSEELMRKTISNAAENARKRMGGPYAAIIADTGPGLTMAAPAAPAAVRIIMIPRRVGRGKIIRYPDPRFRVRLIQGCCRVQCPYCAIRPGNEV